MTDRYPKPLQDALHTINGIGAALSGLTQRAKTQADDLRANFPDMSPDSDAVNTAAFEAYQALDNYAKQCADQGASLAAIRRIVDDVSDRPAPDEPAGIDRLYSGVYMLRPDASAGDLFEALTSKLAHMEAFTDPPMDRRESLQGDLLHMTMTGLQELATDARVIANELYHRMMQARRERRTGGQP